MLTSSPNPPNAMASKVPSPNVQSRPAPRMLSPLPRTMTYGSDSTSATGHGERAATNLAKTICRRLAGERSRGSSVPRSRSPLMLSAPTTRLSRTPNEIADRSVRNTISAGGIRLSWLSTSRAIAVADIRTLNRISSTSSRPPSHRSVSSLRSISHQVAPGVPPAIGPALTFAAPLIGPPPFHACRTTLAATRQTRALSAVPRTGTARRG